MCEFFNSSSGKCAGYGKRPFDCKIYPFAVAKSPSGEDILLVIDSLCANTADILSKLDPVLLASLDFPENSAIEWEETFIPLKVLKSGKNTSDDFSLLERKSRYFFTQSFKNPPSLSAYGFAYHFIWDDVTKYYWKTIEGVFCVFSKTGEELIMPLSPAKYTEKSLSKCFELMGKMNSNKEIPRIENAGEAFALAAKKDGFKISVKDSEYLYNRKILAELKGDKYKSMRWLCNTFEENIDIECRRLNNSDINGCARLLNLWYNRKMTKTTAENDLFMLRHSLNSNRNALSYSSDLGLSGMTLRIGAEIVAYTLGAPLNKDTFCIYFEIANPDIKGSSQYIFREFCRKLKGYKFVNTMGDEGIEGLKKAKDLYKPVSKVKNFTIKL